MKPGDKLKEIENKYLNCTQLPYNKFPIVFIQKDGNYEETGQSKIMNEFMQLGLDASHDVPFVIHKINKLTEALEKIKDHKITSIDKIYLLMQPDHLINIAREALKDES